MLVTPIDRRPISSGPDSGPDRAPRKLKVTVVFTSIGGTVAALTAAALYAKALSAEMAIAVAHVVYFRYPLDRPPVPPMYLERLCRTVAEEANVDPDGIALEIRYCRDQLSCLEDQLKSHSLVVLGAEKGWRSRKEKALAAALRQRGHDVVLVYATRASADSHGTSVVEHMLL